MTTQTSPSSPSKAVPTRDRSDALRDICRHLRHLRGGRSTEDTSTVVDMELLGALASTMLNTPPTGPSDTALGRERWSELVERVDAALARARKRIRPTPHDEVDDCLVLPLDVQGWIEAVVPIHTRLIAGVVEDARLTNGKETLWDVLAVYELLGKASIDTADEQRLWDLLAAVDGALQTRPQDLPGDHSVVSKREGLDFLVELIGTGPEVNDLSSICLVSGVVKYAFVRVVDVRQEDRLARIPAPSSPVLCEVTNVPAPLPTGGSSPLVSPKASSIQTSSTALAVPHSGSPARDAEAHSPTRRRVLSPVPTTTQSAAQQEQTGAESFYKQAFAKEREEREREVRALKALLEKEREERRTEVEWERAERQRIVAREREEREREVKSLQKLLEIEREEREREVEGLRRLVEQEQAARKEEEEQRKRDALSHECVVDSWAHLSQIYLELSEEQA